MTLLRDFFRLFLLLGVVGAALYVLDPANAAVFHMALISTFLIGVTHLTRRVLFNKIDLQEVALTAVHERNMAAALVFASICALLLFFALLPVMLLSGH